MDRMDILTRLSRARKISDLVFQAEEFKDVQKGAALIAQLFVNGEIDVVPIIVPKEVREGDYNDVQWARMLLDARVQMRPIFDDARVLEVAGFFHIPAPRTTPQKDWGV